MLDRVVGLRSIFKQLLDLGVAYRMHFWSLFGSWGTGLDALGQGSETNDDMRCVEIAWYAGVLLFHKFERVICRGPTSVHWSCAHSCWYCSRCIIENMLFYIGFKGFFDCCLQALDFLSETLNTESLKTHWFYRLIWACLLTWILTAQIPYLQIVDISLVL